MAFVLVAAALLFATLRESPRESGMGLGLIAVGLPFYYYWKRRENSEGGPPAREVKARPEAVPEKRDFAP